MFAFTVTYLVVISSYAINQTMATMEKVNYQTGTQAHITYNSTRLFYLLSNETTDYSRKVPYLYQSFSFVRLLFPRRTTCRWLAVFPCGTSSFRSSRRRKRLPGGRRWSFTPAASIARTWSTSSPGLERRKVHTLHTARECRAHGLLSFENHG